MYETGNHITSNIPSYFFSGFNANICYSESIANLTSATEILLSSKNVTAEQTLINGMHSIPLAGYESHCTEINNSISTLNSKRIVRPNKSFTQHGLS